MPCFKPFTVYCRKFEEQSRKLTSLVCIEIHIVLLGPLIWYFSSTFQLLIKISSFFNFPICNQVHLFLTFSFHFLFDWRGHLLDLLQYLLSFKDRSVTLNRELPSLSQALPRKVSNF